jgi:hypothetical protein
MPMTREPRHSLAVRRAGLAALAVIVMLYLGVITYWRFDGLDAASRATVLAAFWAIGIVALALLARGWRR